MLYPTKLRLSSTSFFLLISAVFVGALLVFMVNGSAAKGPALNRPRGAGESDPNKHSAIASAYGKLPLSFEANVGQADKRVRFIARGIGYRLFLTSDETVLALRSGPSDRGESNPVTQSRESYKVLRMKLVGAQTRPAISGLDELPGKLNYFVGNDPRKWRKGVSTYSKVKYRDVYPGVDVVYHGNQGQLEYDFVIAPGKSPRRIKMAFTGMERITVDPDGALVLRTHIGDVRQPRPIAYQIIDGEHHEVAARYQLKGNKVGFEVGAYDKNEPLTIDPVLIYSSFLGGTSGDQGHGIAVDAQGSAYLVGSTTSTDFPLAGAFQGVLNGFGDVFVVKINPAGTALIYSTYLGGEQDEVGNAIAVDAQGSAYVVGSTVSNAFPVTPGAFQNSKDASADGFLTKLSPSGSSLVYSTFLGGEADDFLSGIAVSSEGRAHVVGRTESTRFRTVTFPTPRNGSTAYKSVNAGGQWAPSATGLAGSMVNGFGLDPTTPNTVYAATNGGVFKSNNAGASWSLTGTPSPSTAPQSTNVVIVDPSNSNVIYAAGAFSGVYKSVDGGNTYAVKNNGFQVPFVSALAIDPTTATTLYAGTAFGIYKTTNGGDSWLELSNGFSNTTPRVNEVVIDPTNPANVYVGTNRGMYKTTNGGALWTAINSAPLSFSTQISALAIDPLNPSILYATGLGARLIYKTINGGETWTVNAVGSTGTTINALGIDPVTPTTVYAGTNVAGIFKSTDGGVNWNQSNTGLANRIINGVVVDGSNPAIVYAGASIGGDAFAVKFEPSGSALDYLMNFGGSENEDARGVGLDPDGNAYIVGLTASLNFPVTNAFQSASGGFPDAFVAKLNSTGSGFIYSTYLGGSGFEQGSGIAVRAGSAYVVGQTSSTNFPVANPLGPAPGFTNAFVTKFSPSGASLDFSTHLGGSRTDQGFGIALGNGGDVFVTGSTSSPDFPTVSAPQSALAGFNNAFVTKLNFSGTSLIYSTYLGGSNGDQGNGIAVDTVGNAYVVGSTTSVNFPTVGAFQPTLKTFDAFVTKIGVEVDVSISKTDSRDPVMVNNALTYTLSVTNSGPSPATGVTVTDLLPSGMVFGSATPTQGTCSFNNLTVTCLLGNLAVAATATVSIVVTPTITGTFSNSASVAVNDPDRNPANNTAMQTTTVSNLPSIYGSVRDGGGNGVDGVLMTLSGSQSATQQTDANGFYQFAELPSGGNYTISPSKTGYSFEPPAQTFNNLNADQTANFLASPCSYTLSPTAQSFSSGGGSGSVAVTSLQGCPWTASSNVDWITITSGASGVGSGTVNFTVSPTTLPRAGRLTIGGKNFAVYQEYNSCAALAFSVANYDLGSALIIRAADFNNDGRLDLLVGGGFGNAPIMLNNGLGGFTISNFSLSPDSRRVAIADFNGDGLIDIASTSYNSLFVRIFPNNGSGGFGQQHLDIPFSSQGQAPLTLSVFTLDLNNDANQDLLVSTPGANAIQVLLGNGSGGFTQQAPITGITVDVLIGVADVNADGAADLIFAGGGDNARELSVRLSNGAGNVGAPIVSSGPRVTLHMATADFNGDGKLDIAASAVIPDPASNTGFTRAVSIFRGNGDGHFTLQGSSATGYGDITVADFNNDAKPDIGFVKGGSTVTVVLGDGAGGLGATIQVDTGASDITGGNYGIASGDFDADSKVDIAVADYGRGVSVLRNTCAPVDQNPIEDSRFFVRQHYHDFLNREPDAAGLDFWANQIDQCSPAPCREVKRINVSAAFFLSIEFQQTGYLVYRVYKAAYGDVSSPGNPNPVPIIRLSEFLPDTQRIGLGVQVGIGDWEQQLESNKTAYLLEFVQRPRFLNEFPVSLTPGEFVDKLNLNAGGVLSQAERDQLVAELTGATDMNQGRASVLRKVAEDADMNRNETNRAFVQMQYFGYLRRNPNDPPDSDFAGWQFWLNKLDQFNGNFVEAEMVKAFITSGEYTHRFGR